jgi:hypothetical protein
MVISSPSLSVTAAANTGMAKLPVILAVCQTNPTSRVCQAAPAPSRDHRYPAERHPNLRHLRHRQCPRWPTRLASNRVFVTFTDSGGTLRGETSVAARTL